MGETFIWFRPIERLQVGAALLWKQGAFRGLANYELIPERADAPSLRVGFGVQGIGTGNPGYFATSEKSFNVKEGSAVAYVGVGWRANEDHAHGLGGLKFTPRASQWTFGVQLDGHWIHPFATLELGKGWSAGAYLVEGKSPGIMVSWSK